METKEINMIALKCSPLKQRIGMDIVIEDDNVMKYRVKKWMYKIPKWLVKLITLTYKL